MLKFNLKKLKYNLVWRINFLLNSIFKFLYSTQRGKSLTVIPHEGLGDLIVILPALQKLHKEGVHIRLATDGAKWSQLKSAFMDVPDVDIIQFVSNANYSLPRSLQRKENTSLVALGHFSKFGFIIDYPYSFYWQLGLSRSVMTNPLFLKPCDEDYILPDSYDFIDLGTSSGMVADINFPTYENRIICLNNTDVVVVRPESQQLLTLDPANSFQHKISIALRSRSIICSDAALFNAVIRMRVRPKIIVYTRKHYHSHAEEIYEGCKFDGGIHEFPARNDSPKM